MTPRWRAVLQVQRLLRQLLENHVPLGVLHVEVDRATTLSDPELVKAESNIDGMGLVHELARQLAHDLVDEEPFVPRPPGEPRDLLRIADELRRRIALRKAEGEHLDDAPAACVRDELVALLEFVLPLQGAPLPEIERFGVFLESERFFAAMQAYRHALVEPPGGVAAAFEAVKAALLEAARR